MVSTFPAHSPNPQYTTEARPTFVVDDMSEIKRIPFFKAYILSWFLWSFLLPRQFNEIALGTTPRAAYYEYPWVGASERTPPVSLVGGCCCIDLRAGACAAHPRHPPLPRRRYSSTEYSSEVAECRGCHVSWALLVTGQVSTVSSPVSSPLTSDLRPLTDSGVRARSVCQPRVFPTKTDEHSVNSLLNIPPSLCLKGF